jgi:hypothetical protein
MVDSPPVHPAAVMRDFGNNFTALSFRKARVCDTRKKSGTRRNGGARGIDVGILDKVSGAPGRTRTSTDVNPPDFESGASTNSATGACRRPKSRGRTARIIAKRPVLASDTKASRRARWEIQSRHQGMDRASRSGLSGRRREINSNTNCIYFYSNNSFYVIIIYLILLG